MYVWFEISRKVLGQWVIIHMSIEDLDTAMEVLARTKESSPGFDYRIRRLTAEDITADSASDTIRHERSHR